MFTYRSKKIVFLATVFLSLFLFSGVKADSIYDIVNFKVDKKFDATGRSQISATLVKIAPNLYFYIEKEWWDHVSQDKKNGILKNLDDLSVEFSSKIYPKITSLFGEVWTPGIDSDGRITILLHQIKDESGGYFRTNDEYSKLQIPDSNEREMIYINIDYADNPEIKVQVAHEFTHLVTFNQKEKILNSQEEVWLNEARADYSSTILGYNDVFEGSNLQKRMKDFINSPSDSLTEWQDTKYDYAVASLFMHYLVDHYGISVLSDSLKLKSVGIESINEILFRKNAGRDFAGIFADWTIATAINDCSMNSKYCYLNPKLGSIKINPTLIFLPLTGDSSLSSISITKNWAGNWRKIIGGRGDLKLEFSNSSGSTFQVPYIVYDKDNNYFVNFIKFDQNQKGEINVGDFGKKYNSLIIIPSLRAKVIGFNGFELTYPYTLKISIIGNNSEEEQKIIENLLAQIDYLKKQIAAIKSGNSVIITPPITPSTNLCLSINNNLYIGATNKNEIICLQQFLKNQGVNIYPEALITGYFGNLTRSAVVRFQEKYGIFNTGFVGPITRAKINELLLK